MSNNVFGKIVDTSIRMAVGGPALAAVNENTAKSIGEAAGKAAATVGSAAKDFGASVASGLGTVATSVGSAASSIGSAVTTAGKKLKNADAQRIQYGKLFNFCDFSLETFAVENAIRFKGTKVTEAINEAKKDLHDLAESFDKVAKGYQNIIDKCGTLTAKLEDDNEFGKVLKKYVKSLKNRAKYCKDREKTLEKMLEVSNVETINVSTIAERAIEAAVNALKANEQDN